VMNFGFIAGSGVASIVGGLVIGALSQRPAMVLPVLGLIHPWQMTFFVVGIPGLIVALMMATVPEPVRRGRMALAPGQAAPASIPIRDVLKFLFTHGGTYGPLLGGLALHTLMTFGMAIWMPAFYIRHFHWTPTRYGLVLGLVSLAFAPLGAMFGSWLAERWAKQGKDDANMRIVVWSSLLTTPVAVLLPLMPTASLAVAFAIINSFIGSWVLGPQNAAMQIITPNQMRGQVTALYLFMFNVIGFGLGPTVVALITNQVFSEAQVGYSLATTAAIFGPISTLVIFIGLKAYGRSVALARQCDRSA